MSPWICLVLIFFLMKQRQPTALTAANATTDPTQQLGQGLNSLLTGLTNALKQSAGGSKGGGGGGFSGGGAGSNPNGSQVDNSENWDAGAIQIDTSGPSTLQNQVNAINAATSDPGLPVPGSDSGVIGAIPGDSSTPDLSGLFSSGGTSDIVGPVDTSNLGDPSTGTVQDASDPNLADAFDPSGGSTDLGDFSFDDGSGDF